MVTHCTVHVDVGVLQLQLLLTGCFSTCLRCCNRDHFPRINPKDRQPQHMRIRNWRSDAIEKLRSGVHGGNRPRVRMSPARALSLLLTLCMHKCTLLCRLAFDTRPIAAAPIVVAGASCKLKSSLVQLVEISTLSAHLPAGRVRV